jgi:hypothetical protein
MLGNSSVSGRLAASERGLSSMELFSSDVTTVFRDKTSAMTHNRHCKNAKERRLAI